MTTAQLSLIGVALVAFCGLAGTLVASWISNRAQLRQQASQAAIDEKKVDREEFDSITRELRASVADLKRDLQHEQQQRRLSNTYARTLAQVLRENGMPVPQPPDGLDLP